MVRAQSDKGLCPGNNCPNYIQRTVWDGDQVLLEIRRPGGATATDTELANDHGVVDLWPRTWICDPNADPADCVDGNPPGTPIEDLCRDEDLDQAVIGPPGCIQVLDPDNPQDFFPYGVTAYIHGGELDRPLSIYRDDHSVDRNAAMRIQPIANWKGDFVTGAFFDGTAADCMASAQPSCIDIQWPGERVWHGWENKDPELVQNGPRHWMGSLVYGSADASGLLYRRNRYTIIRHLHVEENPYIFRISGKR